VPYSRVLSRAERTALVPEPAGARVVLGSREGESFTLEIGPPRADGSVSVWGSESSTLFLLRAETLPLLAPERSALAESAGESPWAAARDE